MGKEIPPHSPGRTSHKPRRINLQVGFRVAAVLLGAIGLTSTGQAHADSASRERELRENQAEALKKENQELLKQLAELRKYYKQMIANLPEGIDPPPELFDNSGEITEAGKKWLSEKFPEDVTNIQNELKRIRGQKGPAVAETLEKMIWQILAIMALVAISLASIAVIWAVTPFSAACVRIALAVFAAHKALDKATKTVEVYYNIYFNIRKTLKFFRIIPHTQENNLWKRIKSKKLGETFYMQLGADKSTYLVTLRTVKSGQAMGTIDDGEEKWIVYINSEYTAIIPPPSKTQVVDSPTT